MGVTYDAGAILAAEADDRSMWALHAGFLAEEVIPTVPAPVVVETWRGGLGQDAVVSLLAGCVVEPLEEARARKAGTVLGRASRSDVTDAVVADGALERRDVVVTADPHELRHLAGAIGADLPVVRI